jgi:branched-chain amino acid transport system substrate-binding protein
VPARWLALAALLAAVPLLSGCAASTSPDVAEATGGDLTVYSSLPLQGPQAATSEQLIGGEKLALYEAGGRAGAYKIAYDSLDDAEPTSGSWSAGITATNAKTAAQDTSTIAYLGDFDSAATAVSLPLINGAGILQISPASPYVGLTSSLDAGQDEPGRFYPSGRRTFVRLQPGDPVEAAAQVRLARLLGVHSVYVLAGEEGRTGDAFELPLTELFMTAAQSAGIAVRAHESITTSAGALYTEAIHKILASDAQALFMVSEGGPGAAALWRQLHSADPRLKLLGSSTMATEAFASQLGPAAAVAYLTTPLLAPRMYPRSARHVLEAYRQTFGREAGPEVLYGYEAMNLVLDAVRASGAHADNRHAVIEAVMHTRERNSVIGRYSIEGDGEATLTRYGVDAVTGGRPVFYRAFSLSRSEIPGD